MRLLIVATLLVAVMHGQQPDALSAARNWRQKNERAILQEYLRLLEVPNVASDRANIRRNAELIVQMMERRGVKSRLLEVEGANPVVYGEILRPGATRTVIYYAHYDGQPVDPKEWTGGQPFQPVFREYPMPKDGRVIPLPVAGPVDPELRIYARSASDDKAPIQALLSALDALKVAGISPTVNVKFVFEGEEEAGSTNLKRILSAHKDVLRADLWLICDGPVDQSGKRQIVFGARGIQTVDLTVYGPKRELHSGHYGNWAPNPAFQMARLLASMKDDDGRILVEGFYDDIMPLSDTEKRAVADAPDNDEALRKDLALGRTDGAGKRLGELITVPSLNIRGMASARVGDRATNVIPSEATATIDMRLVKGITPEQASSRLRRHIEKQGYFVTDREPDADTRMKHAKVAWFRVSENSYNAVRTSMDLPISQMLLRNVERAFGKVVKRPNSGGSVPLAYIEEVLQTPTIGVPIVNHDNSQHSFNENLRLQNLWDGIEMMAVLLTLTD